MSAWKRAAAHTIIGIVNFVGAPSLPIQVIKLCVWTRWSSGVGQFEQITRLVGPDEQTLLAAPAVTQFHLDNENSHTTNVNIFGGLQFAEAGAHHIEILLDGELKLRYPCALFSCSSRRHLRLDLPSLS